MLPLLSFVLLRLGVCRNFPRAIIFAPPGLVWNGNKTSFYYAGNYPIEGTHTSHLYTISHWPTVLCFLGTPTHRIRLAFYYT